jgi:hypothetical protein
MRKLSQKSGKLFLTTLLILFISLCGYAQPDSGALSQWLSLDSKGNLVYKTLERGDKIMDFSSAGYMGGGVKIPDVTVKLTVIPGSGNDAAAIQEAIDRVSKMPLVNGFRGSVLLKAGIFNCEQSLSITASGVVLRGSGSGEDGTIINMTGEPHTFLVIKGVKNIEVLGKTSTISDAYVPSGSNSFNVTDASFLKVGDRIRISRPVTDVWVHFMGMDTLVRDGKKQTWIKGETLTDRTILEIEGAKLTVDVPLTDSFDSKFLGLSGATIFRIAVSGEIVQVGVENMRIVSPPMVVTITDRSNKALSINGASDSWIRNVEIINTVNSMSVNGNRITVENVDILHSVATEGAAKPADFSAGGGQILFNRCSIKGDNLFFFATGARVSGPIVLLHCVFRGIGWIQPHQRWSTGLLVDGCMVPEGGIDFMNRGEMGSGHGWTIGWAVAWNCSAKRYINQMPPGAANWVIGCAGEREKGAVPFSKSPMLTEGYYDAHGTPVVPASLYLKQLSERLGVQSQNNIN